MELNAELPPPLASCIESSRWLARFLHPKVGRTKVCCPPVRKMLRGANILQALLYVI
jgi:hypothetical protein